MVRAYRRRLGLTQEELARSAGLSTRSVGKIEAGQSTRPRPATVRLLATAFGLTGAEQDRFYQLAASAPDGPAGSVDQAAGGGVPLPAQLPPGVRGFTGRGEQLASLEALPVEPPTGAVIAAIVGAAGVGKTALAVHWAHTVAGRFPDGQLYVNLRGFDPAGQPMDPAVAVRGFLAGLAVPAARLPATEQAQLGLYRSLLAGRRMLILLDNARDAAQVRPLLPGAPGCLVLVTSRDRLTGLVAAEGAYSVTLEALTRAEARQLLERRVGPERVAAEPGATDEIISRCERLPLALAVVAAGAATRPAFPLSALADQLRQSRRSLDGFAGPDPVTDVRAAFSWSYRSLSHDAARLFRLLGLHPGPDTAAPAAASLAGIPPERAQLLLAELTHRHLADERSPGRYTLHDLLHTYAIELAGAQDTEQDRHAAQHRLLDHYLQTAHAAALLLYPQRDPIALASPRSGVTPERLADSHAALAWFTANYPALLAALRQAATAELDPLPWQLAWTMRTFFERHGHWQDMITAHRAALESAHRTADPIGLAQSYRGLAGGYLRTGRFDEAGTYLRRALGRFRELADHVGQARTHLSIGYVLGQQGGHAGAFRHAEQALDLFRAAGSKPGQASALNDLGWHCSQLGRHEEALAYCAQALTINQMTGSRHAMAHNLDSLGYINQHLGHHEEAVDCYREALTLFRDFGDRYYEADTLTHLGGAYQAAGDPVAAGTAWRAAAAILAELEHPDLDDVRARLGRLRGSEAGP